MINETSETGETRFEKGNGERGIFFVLMANRLNRLNWLNKERAEENGHGAWDIRRTKVYGFLLINSAYNLLEQKMLREASIRS